MKPSEQLYAAARYIGVHGWCRSAFMDASGRVCIYGAVAVASPTESYSEAIARLTDVTVEHPVKFNDYNCRTADDAIAALEIAADIAAAEGR